jgi:hypothetical protein
MSTGQTERRISVIGSSGSGKSTVARVIGSVLDLPVIELDAINWQVGWRDLNTHDPEEFIRRVQAAMAAPAWVVDGNYSGVQPRVLRRAWRAPAAPLPRSGSESGAIAGRKAAKDSFRDGRERCFPAKLTSLGPCCYNLGRPTSGREALPRRDLVFR